MQTQDGKERLRGALRRRVQGLDAAVLAEWDAHIFNHLTRSGLWRNAGTVFIYVSVNASPTPGG